MIRKIMVVSEYIGDTIHQRWFIHYVCRNPSISTQFLAAPLFKRFLASSTKYIQKKGFGTPAHSVYTGPIHKVLRRAHSHPQQPTGGGCNECKSVNLCGFEKSPEVLGSPLINYSCNPTPSADHTKSTATRPARAAHGQARAEGSSKVPFKKSYIVLLCPTAHLLHIIAVPLPVAKEVLHGPAMLLKKNPF